jgi:hypothetical protein
MAKATLNQVRSLPDYAELSRWNLIFATIPSAASGDFPVSDDINIRCESASVPKVTNEKIEIRHRGHRIFQNGISLPEGQITLTFTETIDASIRRMIKAWKEAVYDIKSGKGNLKADVECTIILEMLDKQDSAVYRYTLYGCFLEDHDLGELNAEGGDVIKPSLTISYDYFDEEAA